MTPLCTRNLKLLLTAPFILIVFSCPPALGGRPTARAQDVARRIKGYREILTTGSDEQRREAIIQLAEIESEKACEVLLRTLKNNLAHRAGNANRSRPYSLSENGLLVDSLAKRKYKKLLPTLHQMLMMKEKRVGLSHEAVATYIYMFTLQPVSYTVEGELKTYPPPEYVPPLPNPLESPASGEERWTEDSLNRRLKDILYPIIPTDSFSYVFGPPSKSSLKEEFGLETLLRLVENGDPLVRPYAVEALGVLYEDYPGEVLPVLVKAVGDKDPRVRYRGVKALGKLLHFDAELKASEASIIISALQKALGDAETGVRLAAIEPLGIYMIGRYDILKEQMTQVVPLLVSALEDQELQVRLAAARALGSIGPLTERVVPALIRLLRSSDPWDRGIAVQALGNMTYTSAFLRSKDRELMRKEIARALLAMVNDPGSGVRDSVANSLGVVGPVVRNVIPSLIKLTKDPSKWVRMSAARWLGNFKVERNRIVPALVRMLKVEYEEPEVIAYALYSLQGMGQEAHAAAPEVRKLLKNENPEIRGGAAAALEKIEHQAKPEGDRGRIK
jgi:HEAT repeat protein